MIDRMKRWGAFLVVALLVGAVLSPSVLVNAQEAEELEEQAEEQAVASDQSTERLVVTEDNGVRLEFRHEPQPDGTHILSILVRNDRLDNIGGLNIYGHLPYGTELIESWTGNWRDENPGRIVDDWVGWTNDEVLAESIQGPWRYRIRITPGYELEYYARVTWIGPGSGDLWSEPITISGPELPPEAPLPTPVPQVQSPRLYKYRVEYTEAFEECNHTRLFGTVENGNGILVKTWNDWGNESISMVGLDRQEGTWERYIGPGARPGVWYAQLLDPETKGPISPVSTVAFVGNSCEEKGAIQSIWIHFKLN